MMFFPPVIQEPAPPPPLPFASVRAEYKWSLKSSDENGSGSLVVRLEPATGAFVLEVFSYGDRLALVDGTSARGYRIILPKEKVDRTVVTLADLPLPFIPQAGSVEALARALALGEGSGLTVDTKDERGPVKLHFTGHDSAGAPVEVILTRKQWVPEP